MKSKAVLTVILLLSILLPVALFVSIANAETNPGDALYGMKICLDPGHGGTDPGAINTLYDLKESDINLEVSYGLRYLLEGDGAVVFMARTGDEYLDNSDRYTFCNLQEADILISVHTNSHSDPTWDGTMTLYGPRESPELAQTLHDVMLPFLRDTRPSEIVDEEDFVDYGLDHFASGVLFKSNMPAAMVEPLLMSNTYEAPLLQGHIFEGFDPESFQYDSAIFVESCADFSCRRGQIAEAIYEGTFAYFDAQSADPPGGEMHIDAIDMGYTSRGRNYTINTAVTIYDSDGQPVPSATVSLQLKRLPDVDLGLQTAVTGEDGAASFGTKTSAAGQYEATVIDVSKAEWTYDPALNVEDSESLTIP